MFYMNGIIWHQFKILNSIIKFIAILMVNNFRRIKCASEMFLHNYSVDKFIIKSPIPGTMRMPFTMPYKSVKMPMPRHSQPMFFTKAFPFYWIVASIYRANLWINTEFRSASSYFSVIMFFTKTKTLNSGITVWDRTFFTKGLSRFLVMIMTKSLCFSRFMTVLNRTYFGEGVLSHTFIITQVEGFVRPRGI